MVMMVVVVTRVVARVVRVWLVLVRSGQLARTTSLAMALMALVAGGMVVVVMVVVMVLLLLLLVLLAEEVVLVGVVAVGAQQQRRRSVRNAQLDADALPHQVSHLVLRHRRRRLLPR